MSLGITVWDRRETLHHGCLAEVFGSDALARLWTYGGERVADALPAQYALAERLLARQAKMPGRQ